MKPRTLLYLDCFSGIAGDMFLGCLLDLGLDLGRLRRGLKQARLGGYTLTARRVARCGISGTQATVTVTGKDEARGWQAISEILNGSRLPAPVRKGALKTFRRLLEAEARIHGKSLKDVHLHEAGAIDALVDVTGAHLGLHLLGVDGVLASPVRVGTGFTDFAHGRFPVPAPAALELLRDVPLEGTGLEGELVTPTGAALLATLAETFRPLPPARVQRIGYGAGTREYPRHPNLLRGLLLEVAAPRTARRVVAIEANLDDATPQLLAAFADRALRAGARDVFTVPTVMKKGRAGHLVTVLAAEDRVEALVQLLFRETPTLGCRLTPTERVELDRRLVTVQTTLGPVRVKVGEWNGTVVNVMPEFKDLEKLAKASGRPLKTVQQLVWRETAKLWGRR